MAEESKEPREVNIHTGGAGLVMAGGKVAAMLTNEKILVIIVAGLLVWVSSSMITTGSADRINSQRMYDDARERDRQHCDGREDKIARESKEREDKLAREAKEETKAMREWYAAQADVQRKYEQGEREKDRAQLAELAKQLARIKAGGPVTGP